MLMLGPLIEHRLYKLLEVVYIRVLVEKYRLVVGS